MKRSSQSIIILGASARAAAFSARRANLNVITCDLFADLDTEACATASRVDNYPDDLISVALNYPKSSWLYTGAIENYPELIDRVSTHHILYGNSADVLQSVQNPFQFSSALLDENLHCPQIKTSSKHLSVNHSWVKKPWSSGGGTDIEFHNRNTHLPASGEANAPANYFFQQFIEGPSYGAVYLASAGRAVLLGVSRQIIDSDWTGAGRFQYAGSLGPIRLTQKQQETFTRIGSCLSHRFSLVGIFGIDVVIQNEEIWPIEINPRYTASVEILERAFGFQSIDLHLAACRESRLPSQKSFFGEENKPSQYYGKAVLYASKQFTISENMVREIHSRTKMQTQPLVADIPRPETHFEKGHPVLTLFDFAESLQSLETRLQKKTTHLRRLVENPSTDTTEIDYDMFM